MHCLSFLLSSLIYHKLDKKEFILIHISEALIFFDLDGNHIHSQMIDANYNFLRIMIQNETIYLIFEKLNTL